MLICLRPMLAVTLIPLLSVVQETRAEQIVSQLGHVEVSEVIFGGGPTMLTSAAEGPLDLVVGDNTGLESLLLVDSPPTEAPFKGVGGMMFVQANSVTVTDSSARARYEYDFLLTRSAQLTFLRYTASDNGGEGSFQLSRDGLLLYAATDERLLVNEGRLAPGDYQLVIEASAAASAAIAREFNSTQVDFNLIYVPAPEPSTILMAPFCGCMLLATSARNRARRYQNRTFKKSVRAAGA